MTWTRTWLAADAEALARDIADPAAGRALIELGHRGAQAGDLDRAEALARDIADLGARREPY